MNNTKNLYLITLLFLGFMLYMQWQKDYSSSPDPVVQVNNSQTPTISNDIPAAESTRDYEIPQVQASTPTDIPAQQAQNNSLNIIAQVETPLLKLEFSAEGAALVYAELKRIH